MSLIQHAFRFFNDDGGEVTSTGYAAENAAATLPLDTNIRLRVGITHDGGAAPSTSKYMLFAAPVGSGAWFEVSPTGSGKVKLYQSGGSPNNITPGGMNTSARLSAPSVSPTPSFTAGRAWDDESGSDDVAIASGQRTELEFCIRLISANGAVNGDVYQFRVLRVPAAGAVAFVATTAGDEHSGTGTHTVATGWDPGAGNFALFLCSGAGTSGGVTGVTINGVAMVDAFTSSSDGGWVGLRAFYLANPTAGNVVVTTSSAVSRIYAVLTFSGVNAADPIGTWVGDGYVASNTDTTPTITGANANGMFVNFSGSYATPAGALTFGGDETSRLAVNGSLDAENLAASTKAGSASTTVTTTWASASHINVSGVYLKAA